MQTLAADKIRAKGVKVLTRELGPAGMVQFMQLFTSGHGDYTKDRRRILGALTVDGIVDEIRRNRSRR